MSTVRKTASKRWLVEAHGPWRWLAGLLGLLSVAGATGLAGAAWQESPRWLLALVLVVPFGILMIVLGIRGKASVPLGTSVEESQSP